MPMKPVLFIGYISSVHGFKGEIVLALEEHCPALKKAKFIFIAVNNNDPVPFLIEKRAAASAAQQHAILKLEDVNTVEEAQKLTGLNVFLPEELLHRRTSGKTQGKGLKGLMVVDKNHGGIGVIHDVLHLPEQDVLQIFVNTKEVLIPASVFIITELDKKNKILHVNLPHGLLELYL